MRMLFLQSLRKGLPALLTASALSACGPDVAQDGPGPFNGAITLNVTDQTITTKSAMGTLDPANCVNTDLTPALGSARGPYLITVFNNEGQPVGNADLEFTLENSAATSPLGGFWNTQLIDGDSGDTVSDTGDRVPYKTTTNDDGTKQMFIRYEQTPDCAYAGVMTVVSGSLFVQLQFTTN